MNCHSSDDYEHFLNKSCNESYHKSVPDLDDLKMIGLTAKGDVNADLRKQICILQNTVNELLKRVETLEQSR
jgi:hypothetical protein